MLLPLLFGSSRSRSIRRPAAARPAGRSRPAVEALDERCLPCIGISATLAPAAPGADATGLAALVSAASASHAQPFHLSGAGSFTFLSATDATFTASGTATGLGRWTNEGELHLDGAHGTGVAIFTAANGDKLVALIDGTILNFQTGEAVATFTFVTSATMSDGTIVTSTGRYENVSGSASMQAIGMPDFTFTLDGEISYDASDHSGPNTAGAEVGIVRMAYGRGHTKHPHCEDGIWHHGECIVLY